MVRTATAAFGRRRTTVHSELTRSGEGQLVLGGPAGRVVERAQKRHLAVLVKA